jgi:hypothetical protein
MNVSIVTVVGMVAVIYFIANGWIHPWRTFKNAMYVKIVGLIDCSLSEMYVVLFREQIARSPVQMYYYIFG